MLSEVINTLTETKELASVELSDDARSIVFGYFIKCSDYLVCMQLVDPSQGTESGYSVFEPELIHAVFWGDREHQSIDRLFKNNSEITPVYIAAESWHEAIVELSNLQTAIEIYSAGRNAQPDIGKLLIHDEDWLYLDCLGDIKTLSTSKKLMQLKNITRISFASPHLKNLSKLHVKKSEPVVLKATS